MQRQKLLITGTGGFIFSNFVRRALYAKAPYNIVSIDKVQKSQAINNVYTNKNHKFYIGDITDPHFVNVIFEIENPDVVIHGAAESHVDKSIESVSPFINSNVLGTQIIIDACLKWDVKKLVYISTDEVYGQLENENEPSWTESAPVNPRNPYAASKAAGELLIRAAHETHGLIYNITRSCNNYGPRQTADKFIPKIIKSILNEEKMPIYGQGMQVRDWMHVLDNCDAILKILSDGKPNEIYNISANQEFSNVEVFQKICNVFGRGYNLLDFCDDRKGHDFRYSIDSNKLKKLEWKPFYKFKDGICTVINWYINNQWFLKMENK